jgi:transposase
MVVGLTLQKVAASLCVDTSTVHRIVTKFDSTGVVSKRKYFTGNRYKKLSSPVKLTVLHLVVMKPDIYLWEIQKELKHMFNLDVGVASIYKLLKESNFSRKKLQLVASQRDSKLREKYVLSTSLFNLDMMIFIDETGCDCRDEIRRYGYGLGGKPARSQKLLVRGQRVSVIAAMTVDHILDIKIVRGNTTGEIFLNFIYNNLL